MAALPPLNFLTQDPHFIDYRPAIDAEGQWVVFERTPLAGGPTKLAAVDYSGDPQPRPFLATVSAEMAPRSQTRPDLCWKTGALLFNGADSNTGTLSVWRFAAGTLKQLPNTRCCAYPTSSLDGASFVTENSGGTPSPCNSTFDIDGNRQVSNIDGTDTYGAKMFGGMPATGPNDLPQIAFAGQPDIPNWGGASGGKYDQNNNYIYLNTLNGSVYSSAPMESGASGTAFDKQYQARAPAWSPLGDTIAFESNRSGNGYAIYLYSFSTKQVTPVTDPRYEAQHAKFFPDGTKLILCCRLPDSTSQARGIAWVDITKLI